MIDEDHLKQTSANVAEALARDRSVTDVLHDIVDDATRAFRHPRAAISMADE
ncbi:hypothetical protein NHL50_12640 [Acidimicrobiia bacterium EGI L10123]|uniref:hypothetical protein n=1 Tax=Salinilacustrithrix flava TaxID=2957203 RepID=UPI003D7C2012|nr:hypothetical protein [Acidimicrobiia bacterium EGI L10123]